MTRGLVALLAIAACTDAKTVVDSHVTGIEIAIDIDADLGLDRIRVSAVGSPSAFQPGVLPESPHALAGEQTVVVLLPDSLDGTEVIVRVDGLQGELLAASGGARVTIKANEVRHVTIALGPPVVCGDGVVADLLEACDDGGLTIDDGCNASCFVETGWICAGAPSACRPDTFDVLSATAVTNTKFRITFSDPPETSSALALANYSVPGLDLSGTPVIAGSTVTLTTTSQNPIDYNALVTNVTRARDGRALGTNVAAFIGRTRFDVENARSMSATEIRVTFSDAPDPVLAVNPANYAVPGLVITGTPTLSSRTVSLATSTQLSQPYTIVVANITRAADAEPLTAASVDFTGANGFDVANATSTSNRKLLVQFNAPPTASEALNPANYTVPGLSIVGTPTLAGNNVFLDTGPQSSMMYTVTVANVTRASDGQSLANASVAFVGVPLALPTVLVVDILSTQPNNGTTFFNTGSVTVRITGTQLATVACPTGLALDDRNSVNQLVRTVATSCTVDSDTQITATFPAGIRTNAALGWNVIATNAIGANATSDKLVPTAGLVISEAYVGTGGHEFVELYNRTGTTIDTNALGLRFHVHSQNGNDNQQSLTFIHPSIAPHGFLLLTSSASTSADPWFASRDATYSVGNSPIVPSGGVYISIKPGQNAGVLDMVGWGSQPAGGAEGNALAEIVAGQSTERKPAGGAGHGIDTDNNQADFNAPSSTITPRGTIDLPQP